MRLKGLFLFLLLILPILIITFLYLFGKNEYEVVPRHAFRGLTMTHLQKLVPAQGQATLVGFTDTLSPPSVRVRVDRRIGRIRNEGGALQFIYLGNTQTLPKTDGAQNLPASSQDLQAILTQDLKFKPDTGGLGYWYLLLSDKGVLLNAYDLRKEALLDTLAIEMTIMAKPR